jgi:lipopolysaccharide biosynthesis protein
LRRIAIFAHFDPQNQVKRFVLYHLDCLKQVCDSVVFVSNSPVDATQMAKLEGRCDRVLVRENTGIDFSMWRHGLATIALADWDELLITNSSLFGPVFPLRDAFSKMHAADVDFWGMTENAAIKPHVQSYFLVFRRKALQCREFSAFWQSVLPYRDKYQTIRSYEVGLTTYLAEQGLRYATLIPNHLAKPRWSRKPLHDLTLSRPLALLQASMPYVKISLLRDNPKGVNLKPVYRAIDDTGYDRSMIEFDRPLGTHADPKG